MNRRKRMVSAIAGAALLAVVTISGGQWTVASWGDQEFGSGTFAAKVIAPPVITSCYLLAGAQGLSPSISITWNFPDGTGYVTPGNVLYFKASGGVLTGLTPVPVSSLTSSGPVSGNFTTVFGSALLSGLLGGSYLVGLRDSENGWSSTLSSWTATTGVGGINGSCVLNAQNP